MSQARLGSRDLGPVVIRELVLLVQAGPGGGMSLWP